MYLDGIDIKPKTINEAKNLIGKRVSYLQTADIDKSGRGYFFPKHGVIAEVKGQNIAIDCPGNFVIHLKNLVEMVEA